jgi:hypothetical protein
MHAAIRWILSFEQTKPISVAGIYLSKQVSQHLYIINHFKLTMSRLTNLLVGGLIAGSALVACDSTNTPPPDDRDEPINGSAEITLTSSERGLPVKDQGLEVTIVNQTKNITTDATGTASFTYTTQSEPEQIKVKSDFDSRTVHAVNETYDWQKNFDADIQKPEIIEETEYAFGILDADEHPVKVHVRWLDNKGDGKGNNLMLAQNNSKDHIREGTLRYGALTDSVTLQMHSDEPFDSSGIPSFSDVYNKSSQGTSALAEDDSDPTVVSRDTYLFSDSVRGVLS